MEFVWVFHGNGGQFASGVFSTREKAESWIAEHALSGLLTQYPLDLGSYDWAVEQGHLKLKREYQTSPKFIQQFTAGTFHHHYEDGIRVA